jgi:virginiamycin A acetyltransferase
VWIGTEATILPGVEIGDGAVIGAKAVVGSDVPPYAVVAGNPARVVRRRFDEASVARLRAIGWWDWPAEKITRHLDLIRGADIDALERAAREPMS